MSASNINPTLLRPRKNRPARGRYALLMLLGGAIAGCGANENEGVRLQGQVLHAGEPVPQGRIDFIAIGDTAQQGPGGYAVIEGGRFDTKQNGKSPRVGKYMARINGFDGAPSSDPESIYGNVLFQRYEQEFEVTPDQADLLFEVPKSAAP